MSSRYDEEAERLAKLPRAERFESLIDFPVSHPIKIIGKVEGLADRVKEVLESLGYHKMVLIERPSAKGTYLSLTLTVEAQSGEELDRLYSALEKLPELSYLI